MEKEIKKKIIEIIKGDYQTIMADDAERTADEISELFEKDLMKCPKCKQKMKNIKDKTTTLNH